MQDFRKLKVWQKAFKLGIDVHRAIENGPRWKYPNLRGQTLRAAASISDTIAEGCGKESPRELARYADMASGSAKELLNQLMRACALNYLSRQKFKEFQARIDEIRADAVVARGYDQTAISALKRSRRAKTQRHCDSRQCKSGTWEVGSALATTHFPTLN